MKRTSADLQGKKFDNILIMKFGALGDIILSTPSISAIREQFPSSKITILVGEEHSFLLSSNPSVYNTIELPKAFLKNWSFREFAKLIKRIQRESYDLVIDFQNNKKSHLLGFFSRIPVRLGYHRKFGGLLTHSIDDDAKHLAPVEHQYYLLKELGIRCTEKRYLTLQENFSKKNHIQLPNPIVGINLTTSPRWKTKHWDSNNICMMVKKLLIRGYDVVLTGAEDYMHNLSSVSNIDTKRVVNLVGRTCLTQLISTIAQCCLYISPDSAPLHIAAALDIPIIGLFGPTDPKRHAPPYKVGAMMSTGMACSPCYKTQCRFKTNNCMKSLTPDLVLSEIDKMNLK